METQFDSSQRNQLVFDLPTRTFHWLFAGLFIVAFLIAKTLDDDSPTFSYHMLAGFLLTFLVSLRLIWGFVGTRYSRFSSFALHPRDLVQYFVGVVSGDKRKWAGHNPASSWAALLMMGLTLGLGVTGYLMASGQKKAFEDVHEILANGFLLVVLMHIAGVVLHALRHQDGIAFSMIDGAKSGLTKADTIPSSSSRPVVALLLIVLVGTVAIQLLKNFDSQKQTLNFFGTTLQLGEGESQTEAGESGGESEHDDHDGDDDGDDD